MQEQKQKFEAKRDFVVKEEDEDSGGGHSTSAAMDVPCYQKFGFCVLVFKPNIDSDGSRSRLLTLLWFSSCHLENGHNHNSSERVKLVGT